MPFILIRACLWLILSGAIIARAKIAKTVRKKPAAIMSVVLCTLLLTASAVFPVENLFVRFPSPESVFRCHTRKNRRYGLWEGFLPGYMYREGRHKRNLVYTENEKRLPDTRLL